jgi:heme/copper-type cytochrome/quinol oxidase subunit 3
VLEPNFNFLLIKNNELSFIFFFCFVYFWFSDIVAEGAYQGRHTNIVQAGLKLGMALFILSEVMFFASFFWGFFYVSIVAHPLLGNV